MKKIIILLVLIATLSGCTANRNEYVPSSSTVVDYPDEYQKQTVNGYVSNSSVSNENPDDSSEDPILYYVNIKSKKIHTPDCIYALKSNEENISLEPDYEVLLSEGYTRCKVCNP